MRVHLRLFGYLVPRSGSGRMTVALPPGAVLDDLLGRPELLPVFRLESSREAVREMTRRDILILVDGETTREGRRPLQEGSTVMVIPMAVGG